MTDPDCPLCDGSGWWKGGVCPLCYAADEDVKPLIRLNPDVDIVALVREGRGAYEREDES
jgi:hypothetical protein